jgi:hypothetical protein
MMGRMSGTESGEGDGARMDSRGEGDGMGMSHAAMTNGLGSAGDGEGIGWEVVWLGRGKVGAMTWR